MSNIPVTDNHDDCVATQQWLEAQGVDAIVNATMLPTSEEVPAEDPSFVSTTNTIHVIMPRNTRNGLELDVSSDISYNKVYSAIYESLKNTIEFSRIEIMKFTQKESEYDDNPNETKYMVSFLIIPNELITKLRDMNVKDCIFYVGISEDKSEFKVLNAKPFLYELALKNRDEEYRPYKSNLVTL